MLPVIPHELVLSIFDLTVAVVDTDTIKALRLVNRESALRFSRKIWIVGARTHYRNYILQLTIRQRRAIIKLLVPNGANACIDTAAVVAAQAASEAITEDSSLFHILSKCTRFRRLGSNTSVLTKK